MSTNPAAAVTVPWYAFWSGKKIFFQRTFDEGGTHLLNSQGYPGKVRLKPVYSRQGGTKTLVRFKLKCNSWDADSILDGVRLFPLGSLKPTVNQPLPVWKKDDTVEKAYSDAFSALIVDLQDPTKPDTQLKRLEGIFSLPAQQGINVDRLQIFRFEGAVVDGSDVALVVFTLLKGPSANQNGGGSGPPR